MIDHLAQSTYDLLFVHDLSVSIGWELKCFHTLLVLLTSFSNSPPLTDLLHREINFVVAACAAGTLPIIILLCISIHEIHLLYCVAKIFCRDILIAALLRIV